MMKNNMYQYVSSVLYGGNLLFDQYLTIDKKNITFEQETTIFGITSKEQIIPRKYVRKVHIENNLIGCDVTIYYCYPFQQYDEIIKFNGIKKEEGREIKSLLL